MTREQTDYFVKAFAFGFIGTILLVHGFVTPAYALDLTPLLSQGLDLAVAILTALAGMVSYFLVNLLSSKTKLHDTQMEGLLAQRLNDAIIYGINLAAAAARQKLQDQGQVNIKIDNPFIEIAANYVLTNLPDTLEQFGWDADQLKRAVLTRAEQYFGGSVAQSSAQAGLVAAEGEVATANTGAAS